MGEAQRFAQWLVINFAQEREQINDGAGKAEHRHDNITGKYRFYRRRRRDAVMFLRSHRNSGSFVRCGNSLPRVARFPPQQRISIARNLQTPNDKDDGAGPRASAVHCNAAAAQAPASTCALKAPSKIVSPSSSSASEIVSAGRKRKTFASMPQVRTTSPRA